MSQQPSTQPSVSNQPPPTPTPSQSHTQSFAETVSVTSVIKNILQNYPFGNSLLRELEQNSEDSGSNSTTLQNNSNNTRTPSSPAAGSSILGPSAENTNPSTTAAPTTTTRTNISTIQKFYLDTRHHPSDSESDSSAGLIDPALSRYQGPALLAVNDSIFSESDWESLRNLSKSSKLKDLETAGKFGLGFRSAYHVTDAPFILSGDYLVVFDPHREMSGENAGGTKISLRYAAQHCKAQLSAFVPVLPSLESTTTPFYPGTIIRLPLRTTSDAARSEIKNEPVTVDEIRTLLEDFSEKELGVTGKGLLYLKNLKRVEVYEISDDGVPKQMACAERGEKTTRDVNLVAASRVATGGDASGGSGRKRGTVETAGQRTASDFEIKVTRPDLGPPVVDTDATVAGRRTKRTKVKRKARNANEPEKKITSKVDWHVFTLDYGLENFPKFLLDNVASRFGEDEDDNADIVFLDKNSRSKVQAMKHSLKEEKLRARIQLAARIPDPKPRVTESMEDKKKKALAKKGLAQEDDGERNQMDIDVGLSVGRMTAAVEDEDEDSFNPKKDEVDSHAKAIVSEMQGTIKGQLFTLLPLPLYTGFPIHIEGSFSLTTSRQGLKNAGENLLAGTRDELLVAWNSALFSTLIPQAWTGLLYSLAISDRLPEARTIWEFFPPSLSVDPGQGIPARKRMAKFVVNELIEKDLPVWPLLQARDGVWFTRLEDCFIIEPNVPPQDVRALAKAGVPVIHPPRHIFDLLHDRRIVHEEIKILFPKTAGRELRKRIAMVQRLDDTSREDLFRYLVGSGDWVDAHDLPIIPLCNGGYASIPRDGPQVRQFFVAMIEDSELFSAWSNRLIDKEKLPDGTENRLQGTTLALSPLTPLNVAVPYAKEILSGPSVDQHFDWVLELLAWLENQEFLPSATQVQLGDLGLVPVEGRRLCKATDSVIHLGPDEQGLRDPFTNMGVRLLLRDSPLRALQDWSLVKAATDLQAIVDTADSRKLARENIPTLRDHILRLVSARSPTRAQAAALRQYPIFTRLSNENGTVNTFHQTCGDRPQFIPASAKDLLPVLPPDSRPKVDYDQDLTLIQATCSDRLEILNEPGLLLLGIKHFHQQPKESIYRLVERAMARYQDICGLDPTFPRRVSSIPCLQVTAKKPSKKKGVQHAAPRDVVNPKSQIAQLFFEDEEVFPAQSQENLVESFATRELLLRNLDTKLIQDRISTFAKCKSFAKVEPLVRILLQQLAKLYNLPEFPPNFLSEKWLPVSDTKKLYRPKDCGDRSQQVLIDTVLPVMSFDVLMPALREALGWGQVKLEVLQQQLLNVIDRERLDRSKVISEIIQAIAHHDSPHLYQQLVPDLREQLRDKEWIPAQGFKQNKLSRARRATFARVNFGNLFVTVPEVLSDDDATKRFLKELGVLDHPSAEDLQLSLTEQPQSLDPSTLNAAISALEYIAQNVEDNTGILVRCLVPDRNRKLRPLENLVYDDFLTPKSGDLPALPEGAFYAHKQISGDLVEKLGLKLLSQLSFSDSFEEDFGQYEDVLVRIQSTLQGYDIKSSCGEILSNASDAGADMVEFIVDEFVPQNIDESNFTAPSFRSFYSGPALLIYNSAKFKEKDWEGFRAIGLGSKRNNADSIGHFGLGALSLYHFTDMPCVISGEKILHLDPAKMYLPRSGNQRQRPGGVRMNFTSPDTRSKLSGHVAPFKEMRNFRLTMPFEGTGFRLPLRDDKSHRRLGHPIPFDELKRLVEVDFFNTAISALFFTPNLNTVVAKHRGKDGDRPVTLWSVKVSPSKEGVVEDLSDELKSKVEFKKLTITNIEGEKWEETWIISHEDIDIQDIPSDFEPLFSQKRFGLGRPQGGVAALIKVKPESARTDMSFKMFSTLPLKEKIPLPSHVHANFILTPDRNSIRWDATQIEGRYNRYLLDTLVAKAYLGVLSAATTALKPVLERDAIRHLWPTPSKYQFNEFSTTVAKSMYSVHLPESVLPLFRIGTGAEARHVGPKDEILSRYDLAIRWVLAEINAPELVELPFSPKCISDEAWARLQSDDPPTVVSLMQAHVEEFKKAVQEGRINDSRLAVLADHIFEQDTGLLPILKTASGRLSPKPTQERPLFIGQDHNIALMKPIASRRILDSAFFASLKLQSCWRNRKLEALVKPLNSNAIKELLVAFFGLGTSVQYSTLEPRFLADNHQNVRSWTLDLVRNGLPQLGIRIQDRELSQVPLLPLDAESANRNSLLSLNAFETLPVICAPIYEIESRDLLGPLRASTSVYLASEQIAGLVGDRYSFGLKSLLRCFHRMQNQGTLQAFLDHNQYPAIGVYIGNQLETMDQATWERFPIELKTICVDLPIWTLLDGSSLVTAGTGIIPPRGIDVLATKEFLDTSRMVDCRSRNRKKFKDLGGLVIKGRAFVQRLRLPQSLRADQKSTYKWLLEALIELSRNDGSINLNHLAIVPDGNRQLKQGNQLYLSTNSVFAAAFQNFQKTHMIHESFRVLEYSLASSCGILTRVSSSAWIRCAEAIHLESNSNAHTDDLLTRASTVWSALSSRNICGGPNWDSFKNLVCVPRDRARRQENEYQVQGLRPLGMICKPTDLVLGQHQAVGWSVMGMFSQPPGPTLQQCYPNLGVPSINKAISHLKNLAKTGEQSSLDEEDLLSLRNDLDKTYGWLQRRANSIQDVLKAVANERLFLNIEEEDDPWIFNSANELVFGLGFDIEETEGKSAQYCVRKSLSRFPTLLLAAGCEQVEMPDFPEQSLPPAFDLKASFNAMRQEGKFCDVIFEAADGKEFPAHRVFLAAACPAGFESLFSSEWLESQSFSTEDPVRIDFTDYDEVVLKDVLDYWYTGNLPRYATPQDREAEKALRLELGNILRLCDYLQEDTLKYYIEKTMCKTELLLIRVDTVQEVLEVAKEADANNLENYCLTFLEKNQQFDR